MNHRLYFPSVLFAVPWNCDRTPVFSKETWATDTVTSQMDASPLVGGNFVLYCWQSVSVQFINSKYSEQVTIIHETCYGWLVACYSFRTQKESCCLSVCVLSACRLNPGWRSLVTPCSLFNCSEPSSRLATVHRNPRDMSVHLHSSSIRTDSSAVTLEIFLLPFCPQPSVIPSAIQEYQIKRCHLSWQWQRAALLVCPSLVWSDEMAYHVCVAGEHSGSV
jgi:hypothetical protein